MAKKSKSAPVAAPVVSAPEGTVPPAPPAPPAPPVAEAKPPKVEQPKQNGITRPTGGTSTGKVWEIADRITSGKNGIAATRKEVVDACVADSINSSTATTQFGKWAKFNGFVAANSPGRSPAAPAAPGAPVGAPVPTTVPAGFNEGKVAYDATVAGNPASNPYTEGSPECEQFLAGWNARHAELNPS